MNRFVLVIATLAHLVPHPFGVSSVGATALYAGAFGNRRYSWAVPLIPLFIGAAVFGFYDPIVMAFVFTGFALSTFAGRWLLSRQRSHIRYGAAVGVGACIFPGFQFCYLVCWYVSTDGFRTHAMLYKRPAVSRSGDDRGCRILFRTLWSACSD